MEVKILKFISPSQKTSTLVVEVVQDCGYSSFNIGTAECKKYGKKIVLDPCTCFPRDEIVSYLNSKNPTIDKQIQILEKDVKSLQEQIKKHKSKLKTLTKKQRVFSKKI